MADFKDHVLIFFCFLSLFSWLRQSLFLLMCTAQISKAVLSNMKLILHRWQSVFHCYQMNCPRVWIYLRMFLLLVVLVACVASVSVKFRSKELLHEKSGGEGEGGGEAGGGVRKRLQSNPWILKTAHLAFHA